MVHKDKGKAMIKQFLTVALLGVLMSCGTAPAFAKGSSYSSRPSYSRSYSRPAVTRNVTVNRTTVVHEHNGGGGGSGLLTGMLMGSMLSQPRQVVVEQAPPAQIVQPQVVQPQVVQQQPIVEQPVQVQQPSEESNHPILGLVILVSVGGFILVLHKQNKDKRNA